MVFGIATLVVGVVVQPVPASEWPAVFPEWPGPLQRGGVFPDSD